MTKNYFTEKETMCRCGCHSGGFLPDFREKLNKARELAGIPFFVLSGFRCEEHNRNVGGSETSSHLIGCAADIKAEDSRKRFIIVKALLDAGFTRIGIGKDFVHVDDDFCKDKEVIWLY